jgi:hypothetical protein
MGKRGVIFICHGPHADEAAEKVVGIAPCGRGSESALRNINRFPSRDHRERSSGATFSEVVSACLRMAVPWLENVCRVKAARKKTVARANVGVRMGKDL